MDNNKRLTKIEELCATHEHGTDAAIRRLQAVTRELIEIVRAQERQISSLKKQKSNPHYMHRPKL